MIGEIRAGVKLLELVKDAKRSHSRVYRVVYECCGKESELTLGQINLRRAKRRELCMSCAMKGRPRPTGKPRIPYDKRAVTNPLDYSYPRNLPAYGVTPPTWPVPAIVLAEMNRRSA